MPGTLDKVRLVIADPNPLVRRGLKGALHSIGCREMDETGSYTGLHQMLEQDSVDLLIVGTELEGNDTGFLVRQVRDHHLGDNPFPVVITLMSRAEPTLVRRVIDTGVDDLLLAPVAPEQLISRIQKMEVQRKPFVITHDYTGPDRRARQRSHDTHSAPMLEVPNPLRLRGQSGWDPERYRQLVGTAAATLNRLKIERYAIQIEWLSSHIQATMRDRGHAAADELDSHTGRLVDVSQDMLRRMNRLPDGAPTDPVSELLGIAQRLDHPEVQVDFNELDRLHTLAKGLLRALGSPRAYVDAPA